MGSKAFFSFKSPYAGGLRASVGNGLETVLKRRWNGPAFAFRLTHTLMLSTSDFPPYGGGRGERPWSFLISKCKVTYML